MIELCGTLGPQVAAAKEVQGWSTQSSRFTHPPFHRGKQTRSRRLACVVSLHPRSESTCTRSTCRRGGYSLLERNQSPLLPFVQLNSPMNPVSSSEDIKPPLGLNGVLKVPAHPSGTMASFTKHICAICGDRSSGKAWRLAPKMLYGGCKRVEEVASGGG